MILNPDTVIGEESLRSLYFFMEDHPETGALGLKMINGNGIFLAESKRSFPTPWVSFCKLFGLSKLFPNSPKYASYALPYLSPDEQHEVDVLCGAFMLMRHEALDKIGLLDEDFFMYGEDIVFPTVLFREDTKTSTCRNGCCITKEKARRSYPIVSSNGFTEPC